MATWKDQFLDYIEKLHDQMPEDATLEYRIAFLRKNIPSGAKIYSHGRKSWQAARRTYLARYGYRKQGLGESPTERMIRRSKK